MTIQEQAEQLARKCAEEIEKHPIDGYVGVILMTIPLLELLEVARAAQARNPAKGTSLQLALQSLREKGVEI